MPRYGWIEDGTSSANTAQTITHAAVTGKQHVIFGVSVSYASTDAGVVQLKDGDTVIASWTVNEAPFNCTFPGGIALTNGNAAKLTIAAGGSDVSYGNIHGITVG